MEYTNETRINTIANAKNILNDTIESVKDIFNTATIGDFIHTDKNTGEQSVATTTLGIFCGTGTGAMANNVKKYKGTLTEKLGQIFEQWRKKNEKCGDKITNAVNNTKYEIAENMARAKMDIDQIVTISGLAKDAVTAIFDKIKAENAKTAKTAKTDENTAK